MHVATARCAACAITLSIISAAVADQAVTRFAIDRTFDMTHIKLDLRMDLESKHVDATATLSMTPLTAVTTVTLDAVNFDMQSVSGGPVGEAPRELAYQYDQERLTVYLDTAAQAGQRYELQIGYSIDDPDGGLSFFAPDEDSPDTPYQVWSQGESIDNRYWVPCFDHPNEMQTTEIIANVDAKFEVVSNGRLISREMTSDGRGTFHWLQDQPHAAYLMTLIVGEFAVEQEEWRGIPVTYYVPPDRVADVRPTFRNTTRMLDFFSDSLGVKYPWAQYAQTCCHSFGGGMENTSATTLGERSLRDERALADGDADGLIAHELAHQWFGDLVTCRDWAHLWLNEGFASYFEALWEEHDLGVQSFANNMASKQRRALRGGKKLPIVDRAYKDPDAQFDARAYPKGAWVVHMLRRRLGDDLFWKSLNVYLTDYRHQPVETADLRRTIERVSGRSFERFFYDWTERPGHPVVEIEYTWNEPDRMAEIVVEQTQEDDAFHFPLVIELHLAGSNTPVLLRREMTNKQERFLIPLASRPVRLAVDPHQEVLMDLTETKPRALWIAQLHDDPSPPARIRALRELEEDESDATRELLAAALAGDDYWAVRVELAESLAELGGDIARDALLASMGHEDARVRKACVAGLAEFDADERLSDPIREIIAGDSESYAVTSAAIDTLAAWQPDDLLETITPLLERDSPNNSIRAAAIEAMGEIEDDASVVDLLLDWTAPDKAGSLRRAAGSALAKVIQRSDLDEEPRRLAVDAIADGLTADSRWLRSRAANALGDLGEKAADALAKLRDAQDEEKNDRVKEAIASAIEKITSETSDEEPGKAVASGDGAEEASASESDVIAALREESEALRARIDSLEAAVNGLETLVRRMTSGGSRAAAASASDSHSAGSTSVPIGATAP